MPLSATAVNRPARLRPAPPPSLCRTSELGSAPCHRQRGPSPPRRAPNRSVRSHPCTSGPLGGLHSIRSAAGSVPETLIDSDLCEQGRCVAMPELAWGQQDCASPGSNFKRIHFVLARRLPLKVPPAASRCPYRCRKWRDQPLVDGDVMRACLPLPPIRSVQCLKTSVVISRAADNWLLS